MAVPVSVLQHFHLIFIELCFNFFTVSKLAGVDGISVEVGLGLVFVGSERVMIDL